VTAPAQRTSLRSHLYGALAGLHPEPRSVRSSDVLLDVLIGLYDLPESAIWRDVVAGFMDAQRPALENLYDEHSAFPEARILDMVEAPLVLERLDRDSARLVARWPLALSELETLANAWGVPLFLAA
jgi:hypothetical protein